MSAAKAVTAAQSLEPENEINVLLEFPETAVTQFDTNPILVIFLKVLGSQTLTTQSLSCKEVPNW